MRDVGGPLASLEEGVLARLGDLPPAMMQRLALASRSSCWTSLA